jgi:hypothetical protein
LTFLTIASKFFGLIIKSNRIEKLVGMKHLITAQKNPKESSPGQSGVRHAGSAYNRFWIVCPLLGLALILILLLIINLFIDHPFELITLVALYFFIGSVFYIKIIFHNQYIWRQLSKQIEKSEPH